MSAVQYLKLFSVFAGVTSLVAASGCGGSDEAPSAFFAGSAGQPASGSGGVTSGLGGAGGSGSSAGALPGGIGGGAAVGGATAGVGSGGETSGGSSGSASGGAGSSGAAGSGGTGNVPQNGARVVAYLPNYHGSYATWAKQIDFHKMTHLNLAFALSNAQNGWSMGASDADVKALVDAAHAAGVKVLPSLGGGGGDQTVIKQFKTASNIQPLVDNLDAFIKKYDFDGADVDIEDPANVGAPFDSFVQKVVDKLRPQGLLVTAAVAQWVHQNASDQVLGKFDFLNIMAYTTYDDTVTQLEYFFGRVPDKKKIVAGAAFYGTSEPYKEWDYKAILAADANAWSKDVAQVQGNTVHYTGVASMKRIADMSQAWGGIMFWELGEDVSGEHSLWKAIQDTM